MSVLTNGVFAKELTDVVGIGVNVNEGGVVTAVTGPTWRRVTADPNGVETANAGSIASQTNGTLWVSAGGTVWVSVGGAAAGWALANDVAGLAGSTSPLQAEYIYVSASTRLEVRTKAVSQATALASAGVRLISGAVTITGAVVGLGSGPTSILTGATDCTNAGGTGGASGTITVSTGPATSTAGLSGASGPIVIQTGNSDDGNSGSVTIQTGTAGATRGGLTLNVPTMTSAAQAVDWTVIDTNATALRIGVAGTPGMIVFNTSGATKLVGFSASSLANLPLASSAAADGGANAGFFIRKTYNAGASTTDFALPARTGGWRIVDAYIISGGATGGTVQLQTAGGASNVTDAMVPSALGNGGITRCALLLNNTFAGGSNVRINVAAGAPAGEAFIRIEPL